VSWLRSGFDDAGGVALARLDAANIEGGDAVCVRTRIHPADPLRARAAMQQRSELRRGAWHVAVESEIEVSCTRDAFRVQARLEAFEGEQRVFSRRWDERVPRFGL
jgi:hypothetical protein